MTEQSPLRLAMLGVLVLGLFASLFTRLWYLQVAESQRVEAQTSARENLRRTVYTSAPRGRVLDRNDNVLIDNRLVNEVVVDKFSLNESLPRASDQREFAIKLAREISAAGRLIKAADIEAALADQRYGPFDVVPIVKDVPERFSILIGEREDDFPGVEVRKTNVRFYPYGSRASHLLGYVGAIDSGTYAQVAESVKLYQPTDEIGITGVEASFEDILRGTPQVEVIEVDAAGDRIGLPISTSDAVPGNDIRLTIDINLQALVEEELADGIRAARQRLDDHDEDNLVPYNAPGGAMVLLDPDGSRILAMASFPTYDQRLFLGGISQRSFEILDADETKPLFDRAAQAEYPPGSTFKLITAYAALDSGLLGDRGYLKRTQFLLDEGTWTIPGCSGPGCVLRNASNKDLGAVDLELAITESSNVFFGQLGYQFNVRQGFQSQQLIDVAEDFGYGLAYAAVPNANAGQVPFPETAGESANMAVGQGAMLATPLQIANSYAAIASRGLVYSPMLAEAEIDAATDEVLRVFPTRLIHELYMPDEFYRPLVDGLAGVTQREGGTARTAFENFPSSSFTVCGKTGTVENEPKQDNATFAAFAPCRNPQYAAVAYIEQAGSGGEAAAPIVAAVFARIATGDIDVVPTEAEADDLVSEAEAEAAEEARLQSESGATAEAEAAELAAENPITDDFEVLVPAGSDDGDLPETNAEPDSAEPGSQVPDSDVLVLIPDDEDEGEP